MSPGQDPMDILPFAPVYYDKRDHVMKVGTTATVDICLIIIYVIVIITPHH